MTFIAIVLACFFPLTQPYVEDGFQVSGEHPRMVPVGNDGVDSGVIRDQRFRQIPQSKVNPKHKSKEKIP